MNKLTSSLLILIALFASCKEFIEPSLEGTSINLMAPANKLESNSYKQTFWWETHPDALKYRLQIVSPKFDSIARLVIDTLIKGNQFVYTLEPGKYEWRVRAENGSSQGAYTIRTFTIYPSSIKNQEVQVLSPGNAFISNQNNFKFEWLQLYGATRYRLQIDTNNFADESKLVLNNLVQNTNADFSASKEKQYQWRVKAENDTAQSKWSVVREFIFDQTPPNKVVLTAPANKQLTTKPVKLSWDKVQDANKYELYAYKSDSTTVYSTMPQTLTDNSYNWTLGDTNERILWRVRAIDKAGNKGVFSNFFSFTIQ